MRTTDVLARDSAASDLESVCDERDTLAALVREAPVKCPGSAPESCACGANKWLEKAAVEESVTTDRQREAQDEIRSLPRKVPRRVEAGGRCVACDLLTDKLGDGLCAACYHASLETQESTTDPERRKP